MPVALISLLKKSRQQFLFLLFLLPTIIHWLPLNGQAGVVGYSIKVFADGPVKIKAGKPVSDLYAFDKEELALTIPDDWMVIHADSSRYFSTGFRTDLHVMNTRGDEAVLFKTGTSIGYYIHEKYIVNFLTGYAPINEQVKTVHIKGDGSDVILYIWKAYHIKDAEKVPFTLFTAYKAAPTFKPGLGDVRLYGRCAALDDDEKTEAGIIELLMHCQTYDPASKEAMKNKAAFKAYDMEDLRARIESGVNDKIKEQEEQEKEIIAANESKLEWGFEEEPLWFEIAPRKKEDPVSWMVPSRYKSYETAIESFSLSPGHLLILNEDGLEVIDTQKKELLWYLDDVSFQLAAVNREQVILSGESNSGQDIIAYQGLTGDTLWTAELEGNIRLDWLPGDESAVLIAVQRDQKETKLTGLNTQTGELIWQRSLEHNGGLRNPPLPGSYGDLLITYNNGVETLSRTDGSTAWTNADIKLEDRCPNPYVQGDTLLIIDRGDELHGLLAGTGQELFKSELRRSAEYTNILPLGQRVYLRGKVEDKNEKEPYYLDAIDSGNGALIWSYTDSIPVLSNLMDDGQQVYASTWQGPIAINGQSGKSVYKTPVSEVGRSYPVALRKYGDTIVYLGEMVIAGVDAVSGKILYRHAFDPLSQTMNLDGIDPNCEEIIEYLKFYGKVGLEGTDLSSGSSDYFFNLSRASQDQANNFASLSRANRSLYLSTGEGTYAYRASMNYNSSLISSSFAKAYASVDMMSGIVSRMASQVAEMTDPERKRYVRLMNLRQKLMPIYLVQEKGDYAFRIMESRKKSAYNREVSIVHLPSGKLLQNRLDIGNNASIILNPEQKEFYFQEMRVIPELEEATENKSEGTVAHGYYLVAEPLE